MRAGTTPPLGPLGASADGANSASTATAWDRSATSSHRRGLFTGQPRGEAITAQWLLNGAIEASPKRSSAPSRADIKAIFKMTRHWRRGRGREARSWTGRSIASGRPAPAGMNKLAERSIRPGCEHMFDPCRTRPPKVELRWLWQTEALSNGRKRPGIPSPGATGFRQAAPTATRRHSLSDGGTFQGIPTSRGSIFAFGQTVWTSHCDGVGRGRSS